MPMVQNQTDMKSTWQAYQQSKSPDLRNRLMECYLPLVKYNADRIRAKLPDEVEKDDLISAGVFGLMDAIDAFDIQRGVKFETYCAPRIRGAILDELRGMDWVPRLVRSRSSQIAKACEALEAQLGRTPTHEEITQRLNMTPAEFLRAQHENFSSTMLSLGHNRYETEPTWSVREIDILEDKRSRNSVLELQKRDLKELLTRGLSRAERLILILYYYEEMTMKEIGVVLDLSESRVSQMHSSILTRLKSQLRDRPREMVD